MILECKSLIENIKMARRFVNIAEDRWSTATKAVYSFWSQAYARDFLFIISNARRFVC